MKQRLISAKQTSPRFTAHWSRRRTIPIFRKRQRIDLRLRQTTRSTWLVYLTRDLLVVQMHCKRRGQSHRPSAVIRGSSSRYSHGATSNYSRMTSATCSSCYCRRQLSPPSFFCCWSQLGMAHSTPAVLRNVFSTHRVPTYKYHKLYQIRSTVRI